MCAGLKHCVTTEITEAEGLESLYLFFGTVLVNILIMSFFQFSMPYEPNSYSL